MSDHDITGRNIDHTNFNKKITSDDEFLQGVYQKIEEVKVEKREKEKIEAIKRKNWRKKLKMIGIGMVINTPFIVMLPEMISHSNQTMIILWSFLVMTLGSLYQYSTERGGELSEDRNK